MRIAQITYFLFALATAGPCYPAGGTPIRESLQAFVEQGTVAGAVGLVLKNGSVVSLEAVGYRDLATREPMTPDALFQVHSMSKPVTCAGIMTLIELGRLRLDDPVEQYLPDFRGQKMVVKQDASIQVLSRPPRPITIRDLMTHTSGMGDYPEAIRGLGDKRDRTLADAVLLISQSPVEFAPGSKWQYSSVGINILGRIIEVVSGQPLDRFLTDRIFRPLGMRDTCFFPAPEKWKQIPIAYDYSDGRLTPAAVDLYRKEAKLASAAGGLFSTAADIGIFCQTFLNGGRFGATTILTAQSVDLMTRIHTGDLATNQAGNGFGLGWSITRDPRGSSFPSAGTFSHGGAWGTHMWVDRERQMVAVFLTHRVKGGSNREREAFFSVAVTAAGRR
ncbi:MAG: beta-lactamase family protein [Acidobacteria bacterium]|nr:beta-lactamase family protein [Acidobacteriota bacterium]